MPKTKCPASNAPSRALSHPSHLIVVASRGVEKARSPAICDGRIDLCVELASEHRRKQEGPEHAQG